MIYKQSKYQYLVLLFALTASLLFPSAALADDGAPPPEQAPEAEVTPEPGPSAPDPVATSGPEQPAMEIQTSTDASEPDAVPAPAEGDPAEPADSFVEVVELLDETGSVLVDEEGKAIPLVSEEAAQILSAPLPDPVVCPAGSTSPTDPGCVPGYTTISSAIAAAAAGSVIFVEAGTYTEQIVIDKPLTLIGAGEGATILQAPGSLSADPDGTHSLILIDGATTLAELTGFTITGPGPSGCNSLNYGIYVRGGASANIHDNQIQDIRDQPLGGCQNGVAIQVGRSSAGQTGSAVIVNNEISGYQKNGITVSGDGSLAEIVGNQITGAGPTSVIAQNGIQISSGASAVIQDNLVTGNEYTGPTWTSTGILLFSAADGVVLEGNTVSDNQMNVYVYDSDGLQAADNTFSNATDWDGLLLYSANDAVVDGNVFSGNAQTGMYVFESSGVEITGNQFLDNGWGYNDPVNYYFAGGLYIDTSAPDTLVVQGNSFTGNQTGVWNDSDGDVDVTGNWWGDPSGPFDDSPVPDGCQLPEDNPSGTGDSVSECLVYDAWLTSDPFAPPVVDDPGDPGRPDGVPPGVIPVTGGQLILVSCAAPSMTLLIGDVQVVLTGLCGYQAVLELVLLEESLPGDLAPGLTFHEAVTVTLLKEGVPLEALPEGAGVLVSYLEPSGQTGKVLAWDGSSWNEKDSVLEFGRRRSQVNAAGTFVLAGE